MFRICVPKRFHPLIEGILSKEPLLTTLFLAEGSEKKPAHVPLCQVPTLASLRFTKHPWHPPPWNGVASCLHDQESQSQSQEGGTLSPLFNQVCGPRLRHRHRRPSPPRPERERKRRGRKREFVFVPSQKLSSFPLPFSKTSERRRRARGGKWKVRDGDEWERATMMERERERERRDPKLKRAVRRRRRARASLAHAHEFMYRCN